MRITCLTRAATRVFLATDSGPPAGTSPPVGEPPRVRLCRWRGIVRRRVRSTDDHGGRSRLGGVHSRHRACSRLRRVAAAVRSLPAIASRPDSRADGIVEATRPLPAPCGRSRTGWSRRAPRGHQRRRGIRFQKDRIIRQKRRIAPPIAAGLECPDLAYSDSRNPRPKGRSGGDFRAPRQRIAAETAPPRGSAFALGSASRSITSRHIRSTKMKIRYTKPSFTCLGLLRDLTRFSF
jgi:hypothetical protein